MLPFDAAMASFGDHFRLRFAPVSPQFSASSPRLGVKASILPLHLLICLAKPLWKRFRNDFGSILGPFWDPKSAFKASSIAFDVLYPRSLISNTPYGVLKDFCSRDAFKIYQKSVQNQFQNRFRLKIALGSDFYLILKPL